MNASLFLFPYLVYFVYLCFLLHVSTYCRDLQVLLVITCIKSNMEKCGTKKNSYLDLLCKKEHVKITYNWNQQILHKKWSFPLRISSGFSSWRTSFFMECAVKDLNQSNKVSFKTKIGRWRHVGVIRDFNLWSVVVL